MRASLRTKLGLAFGGLLLLLVVLGIQSTVWLSRLAGSVEVILRENYDSVVACQQMKEALEREDSGALFALAGDPKRGQELAALHAPRFESALNAELRNITLPGEGPLAFQIRDLYTGYPSALAMVLDAGRPLDGRRSLYFNRLLPLFQQIKETADRVQQMNQDAMVLASARSRALAAAARRRMLLLLLIGALLAIACVAFFSRHILQPLARLLASVREVERGNLDLVVQVDSHDEIGQLAAAFNAMAGHLRELRRSDHDRLLRAEQTSQLAIDSLPDAVAVFSPELTVELANRTAVSILGLRPGEPAPARHAEWLPHLLQEAARSGAVPDRGYEAARQIFHEGQERFYLPYAVAVHDASARLVGITVILSDITNLRRIDEMKSGLLSTVSHELRTPLTSLQMALHILLEERVGGLTLQQTELLVAARDDAERLRQILINLLEIARYEMGAERLHLEPVGVRDLIEMSLRPLESRFADRGVKVALDISPAVPKVMADPLRAQLVLGNFLQNALVHAPAGGTVTVAATPEGSGAAPGSGSGAAHGSATAATNATTTATTAISSPSSVRFTVADSGLGIPEEHLLRVFDRFFQVPGTEGGAGLGLAIAKEVVQAHGGAIGVASPPGSGAEFWFTLAAAAAGDPAAPSAAPSQGEKTS